MGRGPGRPKNPPKPRHVIKDVIPIHEIFDEDEAKLYRSLVDVYLKDFEDEDLTSSDMDDIMDLAKNRVLEFRILKTSRGNAEIQLDIGGALEKLKKDSKTHKENLALRRKDRINPNEFKGFSIVDLAVAFDNQKKEELQERIRANKEEEAEIIESRKDYVGNRYDKQTEVDKEEDTY
jgi:hypothetical protein